MCVGVSKRSTRRTMCSCWTIDMMRISVSRLSIWEGFFCMTLTAYCFPSFLLVHRWTVAKAPLVTRRQSSATVAARAPVLANLLAHVVEVLDRFLVRLLHGRRRTDPRVEAQLAGAGLCLRSAPAPAAACRPTSGSRRSGAPWPRVLRAALTRPAQGVLALQSAGARCAGRREEGPPGPLAHGDTEAQDTLC